MTNKPDLSDFPLDVYIDTRCGRPLSVFPGHAVYSETRNQRNLLAITARRRGYLPPKQTCCGNQVKSLLQALQPESATHG